MVHYSREHRRQRSRYVLGSDNEFGFYLSLLESPRMDRTLGNPSILEIDMVRRLHKAASGSQRKRSVPVMCCRKRQDRKFQEEWMGRSNSYQSPFK